MARYVERASTHELASGTGQGAAALRVKLFAPAHFHAARTQLSSRAQPDAGRADQAPGSSCAAHDGTRTAQHALRTSYKSRFMTLGVACHRQNLTCV